MKLKIQYRYTKKELETTLDDLVENTLSKTSVEGTVEAISEEQRNTGRFLGKLTQLLVEKNVITLEESLDLIDINKTLTITKA